jgi:hypothetical protein
MVREGAPSTACSAGGEKDVDGRSSPTMTVSDDSAATCSGYFPAGPQPRLDPALPVDRQGDCIRQRHPGTGHAAAEWPEDHRQARQEFRRRAGGHAIGTARAFQVDPLAGTFAGIAMGSNALLTAILMPLLV